MAAAHINGVNRIGGTSTQDQIAVEVFFYGNGTPAGSKDDVLTLMVPNNSTKAQFQTAVGNAIVARGATFGFTLTLADIGGHG